MAIKVLLVGLDYQNEKKKKLRLDASISSLVFFRERLVRYLGYQALEIQFLVDSVDAASLPSPSSSPSETQVEEITDARHVFNSLERMVQDSQQGNNLIFFFVGHTVKYKGSVLIDLAKDRSGNYRGFIPGHVLEKVTANLPQGVTFYPLLDCCDASATIRGTRQWRPPASFGESTHRRIIFTAVDTDDAAAYEHWSEKWNGFCSDFTYCLIRILDDINDRGNGMLTNYHLVRCVNERLKRRENIRVRKGLKKHEQHPGLFCSFEQSMEKFL